VDTAGYTKFKETMDKAGDSLSTPSGKTTNYPEHQEYRGGDSSTAGDSSARSGADTSGTQR
jgi:hypothetical protein